MTRLGLKTPRALSLFLLGLGVFIFLVDAKLPNLQQPVVDGELSLFTSDLLRGWQVEVNDDSNCYNLVIEPPIAHEGSVYEYLSETYLIGKAPSEIRTFRDPYDIVFEDVIVLGPQGVGNKNMIYIKSETGNIFKMAVHWKSVSNPELRGVCEELEPLVRNIVGYLLLQ